MTTQTSPALVDRIDSIDKAFVDLSSAEAQADLLLGFFADADVAGHLQKTPNICHGTMHNVIWSIRERVRAAREAMLRKEPTP